jgi:hypothetical protein
VIGRACTIALALLAVGKAPAAIAPDPPATVDFGAVPASADTRRIANWVMRANDAQSRPFLIVDKRAARVFAFDANGVLRGTAAVLLGAATGDVSPPGVGTLRLADVTPAMRITPAGRFEASLGRNLGPKDILWIDYDSAVSLHRVVTGKPAERRLQRLASASISDNRISYGCINVAVTFYEEIVQPLFKPADGIVYILPETRPLDSIFADVD